MAGGPSKQEHDTQGRGRMETQQSWSKVATRQWPPGLGPERPEGSPQPLEEAGPCSLGFGLWPPGEEGMGENQFLLF